MRALLAALVALGCGSRPANTPGAVAERFLDLYFVEIDQERALPLVTGPAKEALERELRDVAGVRAGGYSAAEAKGKAYYERTYENQWSEDQARYVYDLTMEVGEGASGRTQRHVLLTLRREAGQWKVSSFTIREGSSPRAP